jgi:hypothetical protein
VDPTETPGVQIDALMARGVVAPPPVAAAPRRAAKPATATPAVTVSPVPAVKAYVVETIRAAKRVDETVR